MTLAIHLQSATVQLIFRRALDRDEQDRLDRCLLGFKLQSKLFEDIEHGWCRWIGKSQLLGGGGSAIGTGLELYRVLGSPARCLNVVKSRQARSVHNGPVGPILDLFR